MNDTRLDRLEKRIEKLELRMDGTNNRIEKLLHNNNQMVAALRKEVKERLRLEEIVTKLAVDLIDLRNEVRN